MNTPLVFREKISEGHSRFFSLFSREESALRDKTKQQMLRRLHSALNKDALACVQIWKSTIRVLWLEMVLKTKQAEFSKLRPFPKFSWH